MSYVIAYVITFPILAIIWVVSLIVYNSLLGGVDFGTLPSFALKSAVLVAVASAVLLLPLGGWFVLLVWGAGAVILFGMEVNEMKIFLIIIWAISYAGRFAIFALLLSAR